MNATALRNLVEVRFPAAFSPAKPHQHKFIPTGVNEIDTLIGGGVPLSALSEICGSTISTSGKTSVLMSLLAQATKQGQFCALVDGGDAFDPASGEAVGVSLPHLLWVRCGKTKQKLPPLEQAFKVTDILVQSSGFGLVIVDLSNFSERVVRKVPLTSWFRFSRVVEKQPMALVFIEREPHATSCAGLVLKVKNSPAVWTGNLFTQCSVEAEIVRAHDKKQSRSTGSSFTLKSQWA